MGTTALGRARKDRFPGTFRISNEQKLSVWMKDEGCKKAQDLGVYSLGLSKWL